MSTNVFEEKDAIKDVHIGIIGAGIAGLSAAYYIRKIALESGFKQRIKMTFIEPRDRIGGRLLTTDPQGNSLIDGIQFSGSPCGTPTENNVLEFGAQWAHDIQHLDHGLRPFLKASGLKLSEPELFTWAQNTNTLCITRKDFPEVSVEEEGELDMWMDDLVADTVLRYDIFTHHREAIDGSANAAKTFFRSWADKPDASVDEIVDLALSDENLERWWNRKLRGKLPSGPGTPSGLNRFIKEDRSYADDFAELPFAPILARSFARTSTPPLPQFPDMAFGGTEASLNTITETADDIETTSATELDSASSTLGLPQPYRRRHLSSASLPEHYQEEVTEDFVVPRPSPALVKLARRLLLLAFSSYYGLDPKNIGYASLESQIEHSEEHRVIKNGYVRLVHYMATYIRLKIKSLLTTTSSDNQPLPSPAAEQGLDASMVSDAEVHFHRAVTHIRETEEGIFVKCADVSHVENWNLQHDVKIPAPEPPLDTTEELLRFDKVVCTLPLGVLKRLCHQPSCYPEHSNDTLGSRPTLFDPPLSAPITKAITNLQMGLLNKLVVMWDDPKEWEQVAIKKRFLFPGSHEKTFCMIVNLNSTKYHCKEQYGYCMYSSPPYAVTVESMSQSELIDTAMDIIAAGKEEYRVKCTNGIEKMVNGIPVPMVPAHQLPKPKRVFTTHWLHDPYSLGAYSCMPKGGTMEDFDSFAVPHGNVHFAGEHTQSDDFGCVHAAIETGQRAAAAIMKSFE